MPPLPDRDGLREVIASHRFCAFAKSNLTSLSEIAGPANMPRHEGRRPASRSPRGPTVEPGRRPAAHLHLTVRQVQNDFLIELEQLGLIDA